MAAARVKNWISGYGQGPLYAGTGTLTKVDGKHGLVLTAAHIFEGQVGPITVEFPDGQVSGGRLLAIDPKLDVAALLIFAPRGIEPVPLAKEKPSVGDEVEIWGYGPKRFRSFLAQVSMPIAVEGDEPKALVGAQGVQDKMVTIPGDSGGPMVQDGELVGVHWGYRGAETDPRRCIHAVGCDRIRDWLAKALSAPFRGRLLGS
ncbi:MAG: trypsin-like peptidase domain-containing protein [Planctomycetes bacterium]|nr:trypsin-like peptidase domain-containing protein [Planctomycetota bacterium]